MRRTHGAPRVLRCASQPSKQFVVCFARAPLKRVFFMYTFALLAGSPSLVFLKVLSSKNGIIHEHNYTVITHKKNNYSYSTVLKLN